MRKVDEACSWIGGLVLVGLVVVWIIATVNEMQIGWKQLAVPGGIGVLLMLPFRQTLQLVKAGSDLMPWGESDG